MSFGNLEWQNYDKNDILFLVLVEFVDNETTNTKYQARYTICLKYPDKILSICLDQDYNKLVQGEIALSFWADHSYCTKFLI